MLKITLILILIILSLISILGFFDRSNLGEMIWEKILPLETVFPKPSSEALYLVEIEERIGLTKKKISQYQRDKQALIKNRKTLLISLNDLLKSNNATDEEQARLLVDQNPVAAVTVRAIRAEDKRLTQLNMNLAQLNSEQSRLEARLLAVANGINSPGPYKNIPWPTNQTKSMQGRTTKLKDNIKHILKEAKDGNQ